ncbi:hypothetical protein QVD17_25611 [Tagetes erecta]|uniref:Uncharacterized protein n=1 Tax=Tagetes erecta TaxID=13708 RepID=A0AAD8KJW8_TARER|nr:hypothetical protein QVD17_25611 [Tagetes erecta]
MGGGGGIFDITLLQNCFTAKRTAVLREYEFICVLNPIQRRLFPINKNSTPLICPLGVTGFEYKRIVEGTGEIKTSSQFSNQEWQ